MIEQNKEEIKANFKRAEESLQAARELIKTGHFDFSASRAYYAVFYSITAALIKENITFR